jgi:hypothetical protein
MQCCESGFGIGYLFDPWIRDGRKSSPGSGIRDEKPGSYFFELRNHFFTFWGVNIHKFFIEDLRSGIETVRIRDPGWNKVGSGIRDGTKSDPGWNKVGSGIRDKHHG